MTLSQISEIVKFSAMPDEPLNDLRMAGIEVHTKEGMAEIGKVSGRKVTTFICSLWYAKLWCEHHTDWTYKAL
jgi:hypothetical protein